MFRRFPFFGIYFCYFSCLNFANMILKSCSKKAKILVNSSKVTDVAVYSSIAEVHGNDLMSTSRLNHFDNFLQLYSSLITVLAVGVLFFVFVFLLFREFRRFKKDYFARQRRQKAAVRYGSYLAKKKKNSRII